MGCCECFGFSFLRKPKKAVRTSRGMCTSTSQECLLDDDVEDEVDGYSSGDMTSSGNEDEPDFHVSSKKSEEILMNRIQNGLICREFPVKETRTIIRSEVSFRMSF